LALSIRFRGDQSDHDVLSKALAEIASLRNDVHQLQIRQPPIGAALNSTDGGSFGGKIKGQFPIVKLRGTLIRTGVVTGDVLHWNVAWTGAGNNGAITVHGDFMRGVFFQDDQIGVMYSPEADQYYARDDGRQTLRVTLIANLLSGGSALAVTPTGKTVTVHTWAPYPSGTTSIPSGSRMVVTWDEDEQKWYEPGSACPT
jgi:hypothetical protein